MELCSDNIQGMYNDVFGVNWELKCYYSALCKLSTLNKTI